MRLFLTLLAVLTISPAYAQDAETSADTVEEAATTDAADDPTYERRLALAKEMHEIWPVRLKVESALDRAARGAPPQRRAAFKAAMRHAIKFEVLEEESIDAMVKIFTTEELQEMVAFYGSPTGRSISAKIDEYQSELSPSFTRMMDKALMDVKTGSAPGNIQ